MTFEIPSAYTLRLLSFRMALSLACSVSTLLIWDTRLMTRYGAVAPAIALSLAFATLFTNNKRPLVLAFVAILVATLALMIKDPWIRVTPMVAMAAGAIIAPSMSPSVRGMMPRGAARLYGDRKGASLVAMRYLGLMGFSSVWTVVLAQHLSPVHLSSPVVTRLAGAFVAVASMTCSLAPYACVESRRQKRRITVSGVQWVSSAQRGVRQLAEHERRLLHVGPAWRMLAFVVYTCLCSPNSVGLAIVAAACALPGILVYYPELIRDEFGAQVVYGVRVGAVWLFVVGVGAGAAGVTGFSLDSGLRIAIVCAAAFPLAGSVWVTVMRRVTGDAYVQNLASRELASSLPVLLVGLAMASLFLVLPQVPAAKTVSEGGLYLLFACALVSFGSQQLHVTKPIPAHDQ